MASPWIPAQRPPSERPWAGLALFVGVPLLSLILLRMLWSGSGIWFLLVGIALIGVGALLLLNRRPQGYEIDRSLLASDQTRLPIILAGGGVIFLTMLLVPNFSGDDARPGGNPSPSEVLDDTITQPDDTGSEVVDQGEPVDTESDIVDGSEQPVDEAPLDDGSPVDTSDLPEGYQVHVVASGDTLWGIAEEYETSVEEIVAANNLANPEALQLDQELIIPPPEASASAGIP